MIDDRLVGPYLLLSQLDGEKYCTFLAEVLLELLRDVALSMQQQIWFQHDGAPVHFSIIVRQYLDIFIISKVINWLLWTHSLDITFTRSVPFLLFNMVT